MEAAVLLDYARNYGTRIHQLIGEADSMEALGMHFGGPLYEAEIRYLVEHEYARHSDDILWRRSKKGLHTPTGTGERVQQWLESHYDFQSVEAPLRQVS